MNPFARNTTAWVDRLSSYEERARAHTDGESAACSGGAKPDVSVNNAWERDEPFIEGRGFAAR